MTPKKTKSGHVIQLRTGAGRRPSIPIATLDPVRAQECCKVMVECARLLVDSGRLQEAHEALLKLGAAAGNEDDFAVEEAAIRALCAEPLPEAHEPGAGITVRQFGEKWTSGQLAREFPGEVFEIKSMDAYKQKLEHHYHTIGNVPLKFFTKKHFRAAMAALNPALKERARAAYAQVIYRLLNVAVKVDVLDANPLPEGSIPPSPTDTEFQLLYPHEDALLCGCQTTDFAERFTYGFAIRTGIRVSTLFPLKWRNINLRTGLLTGTAKDTRAPGKRRKGRRGKRVEFKLSPDVLNALRWWRQQRQDETEEATIFPQLELTAWADRLRVALLAAGVDRYELHHPSETGKPMRFHDLRASFITFALANGKTEAWIRDRTGHSDSQMIVRYQRDHVKELEVHDWLPLDVALGLCRVAEDVTPCRVAEAPALEVTSQQLLSDPDRIAAEQQQPVVRHLSAPPLGLATAEPTTVSQDAPDHVAVDRAHREQDQIDHVVPPAAQLPHGPSATTSAPVVQGNDRGVGQSLPSALPAALLAAQGLDEVVAAVEPGEPEQLVEGGVGEDGGNRGLSFSHLGLFSGSQGVATGVATGGGFWGLGNEKFGFFDAGAPGWTRTTDQKIRNQPAEPLVQRESPVSREPIASCSTRPHEAPRALPARRELMSEPVLLDLLDLAIGARRWELARELCDQLLALEQAHGQSAPITKLNRK